MILIGQIHHVAHNISGDIRIRKRKQTKERPNEGLRTIQPNPNILTALYPVPLTGAVLTYGGESFRAPMF